MDDNTIKGRSARKRGHRKKQDRKNVSKQSIKKDEVRKLSIYAEENLQELKNFFEKSSGNLSNPFGIIILYRWDGLKKLSVGSQETFYSSKFDCHTEYSFLLPSVDKMSLSVLLNQMQNFSSMNEFEVKEKEYERALFWLRTFAQRPVGVLVLDLQKIARIEKVKESNPFAQFVCTVCNYCCNNIDIVIHHISDERHKKKLEVALEKNSMKYLANVKVPENFHSFYSNHLVTQAKSIMMSEQNLRTREKIREDLGKLVEKLYPKAGYEVRLIGSSVHGMGLETAEVNLDLNLTSDSKIPQVFIDVSFHMKKNNKYSSVSINYDADFLLLTFFHNNSKSHCTLGVNNSKAHNLALLLSEYRKIDPIVTKLSVLFRYWGQLTLTDVTKHGTWPGYAFYLMVIFFLQQKGLLPVLHELTDPANGDSKPYLNAGKIKGRWKKPKELENPSYLFQLWRDLFKFYLSDFEFSKNVVAINSSKLVPKETYKWGGKRISILDPFTLRNITRTVTNESVYSYIQGCMLSTFVYYSIPVTKQGPIFSHIQEDFDLCNFDCFYSVEKKYKCTQQSLVDQILKCDLNYVESKDDKKIEGSKEMIEPPEPLLEWQDYLMETPIPLFRTLPPINAYMKLRVTKAQAESLIMAVKQESLQISFTKEVFVNSREPPIYCSGCQLEGHYRYNCPDEFLPPMPAVPPPSSDVLDKLAKVCRTVQKKVKLSSVDFTIRENVVDELEQYINEKFPEAKLHLFGSSANGLGLKNSDLDICLLFNNDEILKNITTAELFNQLCAILKASKSVYNVIPISTAKIPILKFVHRNSRLRGDISCSNLLALENTRLLKTYCSIDERVSIMCQMMKYLMKSCNICDASRGSLSSYAYSLMVIYFLQQCSPPVIPVLQELPHNPKKKMSIDGFEVSYFTEIYNIGRFWSEYGANKKSNGELWLDLLEFYTEKFDFYHHVISIRQSKLLTKLEKLWFTCITIEDPFEQTHNLGSALSKKMSVYILSMFQKARLVFLTSPPASVNSSMNNLIDYYFKHKNLAVGGPPIGERSCRHCGVIKHLMKDCPELKDKREADQDSIISETTGLDGDLERDSSDESKTSEADVVQSRINPIQNHVFSESRTSSPAAKNPNAYQEGVSLHVEEFIKKLAFNVNSAQPLQQSMQQSIQPTVQKHTLQQSLPQQTLKQPVPQQPIPQSLPQYLPGLAIQQSMQQLSMQQQSMPQQSMQQQSIQQQSMPQQSIQQKSMQQQSLQQQSMQQQSMQQQPMQQQSMQQQSMQQQSMQQQSMIKQSMQQQSMQQQPIHQQPMQHQSPSRFICPVPFYQTAPSPDQQPPTCFGPPKTSEQPMHVNYTRSPLTPHSSPAPNPASIQQFFSVRHQTLPSGPKVMLPLGSSPPMRPFLGYPRVNLNSSFAAVQDPLGPGAPPKLSAHSNFYESRSNANDRTADFEKKQVTN